MRLKKQAERSRVENLLKRFGWNFALLEEGEPPDFTYKVGSLTVAIEEIQYSQSEGARADAVQAHRIKLMLEDKLVTTPQLKRLQLIVQLKGRAPAKKDTPLFAQELHEWSKRLSECTLSHWRRTNDFPFSRLLQDRVRYIEHRWSQDETFQVNICPIDGGWVGLTEGA